MGLSKHWGEKNHENLKVSSLNICEIAISFIKFVLIILYKY
jgi:hypothetical protein